MSRKNEDNVSGDEGSKKPKRQKYGAPPPKGLEARKASGNVCTARRTNGQPCSNFAITGANVCRTHGGAAPQVRAKAQVRILMASDLAASKLIEMMQSPKVADNIKLAAAKDLLDRANLAGTQNIEVGVTKRTFEDFVGEAIIDVAEDDDEADFEPLPAIPVEIVDAEIVTEEEPHLMNRHDRAAFAESERVRRHERQSSRRPRAVSSAERKRAEAEAFAGLDRADRASHRADVARDREAMLLAKANNTWNPSSRGEAMREAANESGGKRRARIRDGGMGEG